MILTGYIYDNQNGQGIPYATVRITDNDGDNLQDGIIADGYGYFSIDSPQLDGQGWLYVSSAGYQPVMVNSGVFQESGDIGLYRAGDLAPVVVTAAPNKRNDKWMIFLLAGGGLALVLADGKRKKRVSGIPTLSQNQWIDIALKIGIPVAVFFLVVKPILVALNLLPDKREQVQNESDEQATNQQGTLADFRGTDNHTYNQSTLDSIAVALRNDVQDWWGYEWRDIAKQLAYFTGLTAADARYLLGTFVKKNGYTLWQWYYQEFEDALVFTRFDWDDIYWNPGWGGTGVPYDYRANYEKLGINSSNASNFSWANVVEKFVNYVYTVAGVAKQ